MRPHIFGVNLSCFEKFLTLTYGLLTIRSKQTLREVFSSKIEFALQKKASLNEVLDNIHTTLVASTYFIESLIINENSMSKT
jgi:hypothetical protein